jgi:hypothetical protein
MDELGSNISKFYCTVTSETDYVIEADSQEEAYEAAWSAALDGNSGAGVVVNIEVSKVEG